MQVNCIDCLSRFFAVPDDLIRYFSGTVASSVADGYYTKHGGMRSQDACRRLRGVDHRFVRRVRGVLVPAGYVPEEVVSSLIADAHPSTIRCIRSSMVQFMSWRQNLGWTAQLGCPRVHL